jgi:hypothetical protein
MEGVLLANFSEGGLMFLFLAPLKQRSGYLVQLTDEAALLGSVNKVEIP